MADTNRELLRGWFSAGEIPQQSHFHELIDKMLNQADDGIEKGDPNEPLKITAAKASANQKALQFFKFNVLGNKEDDPSWEINLAPKVTPLSKIPIPGLNIVAPSTGESRLFIDQATGKIGIGTIQPSYAFHLEASDIFLKNPDKNNGLHLRTDSQGHAYINNMNDFVANGTDNNNLLVLTGQKGISLRTGNAGSSGTTRIFIAEDGNVGIGVTNPQENLQVGGAILIKQGNSLPLKLWSNNVEFSRANNPGYISNTGSNGKLAFCTDGSSDKVRMLIDGEGKVGIGVTNPQELLHVIGNVLINTGLPLKLGGNNIEFSRANAASYISNIASKGSLAFTTDGGSNKVRMIIDGDGKVGIGTSTPKELLHINGDSILLMNSNKQSLQFHLGTNEKTYISNINNAFSNGSENNGALYIAAQDGMHFLTSSTVPGAGGTFRMTLLDNGNFGIGTNTPAYKLDVAGPAHATSFPTSSDKRLKKKITPLKNVLDKLMQLNGVSFEWNKLYESMGRSTYSSEIGIIAQEVKEVFPELVTTWGEEEYLAVDYGRLAPVLLEGIKELNRRVEELKKLIEKPGR